jgi:16S rRNA (guanine1516-N2)-methyltransferase
MVTPAKLLVDFTGGAIGHRLKYGGGRGQALSKACGLSKGKTPSIADATAGLGRDSFLLASLGAEVKLIERSKHLHKLLEEGIARARDSGYPFSDIMGRMTLIHGDARDVLPALAPDVVMVDPMHPPRVNSALVKIEMRQLRDIVGADPDALEVMQVALLVAKKRVVLKWPLRADPMPSLKVYSHQILGKSTRFDVFMI